MSLSPMLDHPSSFNGNNFSPTFSPSSSLLSSTSFSLPPSPSSSQSPQVTPPRIDTSPKSDDNRLSSDMSHRASVFLLLLFFLGMIIISVYFSFRSYHSPRSATTAANSENGEDSKTSNECPTYEDAKQSLVKLFEKNENHMVVVINGDDGDDSRDSDIASGNIDCNTCDNDGHNDDDTNSDGIDICQNSSNDDGDIEEGMSSIDTLQQNQQQEMRQYQPTRITRTFSNGKQELDIPDCCTICLEPFMTGESIVWSLNQECQHIYHKECGISYFAYKMSKGQSCLCPTCRREYCTPIVDMNEVTMSSEDGHTQVDIEEQ